MREADEVGDRGRQVQQQRPPRHRIRRKGRHENEHHSRVGMTRSIRDTHEARGFSRDPCLERVIL